MEPRYPPLSHHHYDLHNPPPPLYHPYHPRPAPPYFSPEQQTISTLFVSGLPGDVKAREIHNLFRLRRGFESCQLEYTGRGNQVVAFATFFDHRSAVAAMGELNGAIFDPQTETCLSVELARSNSRTKRPRDGGGYTVIDKRAKAANDDQGTSSNDVTMQLLMLMIFKPQEKKRQKNQLVKFHHVLLFLLQIWDQIARRKNLKNFYPSVLDSCPLK